MDSPPKGKRGGREGREREREGGVRKRGGSWLGAPKAEVGVVFPVNTELQRVRGEGFNHGNAEKRSWN